MIKKVIEFVAVAVALLAVINQRDDQPIKAATIVFTFSTAYVFGRLWLRYKDEHAQDALDEERDSRRARLHRS